jgi:hypothetical protein
MRCNRTSGKAAKAVCTAGSRGSAILFCLLRACLIFGGVAGLQRGAEAPLAPASGHLWGLWVRGRWPSSQLDLWGQAPTGIRLWA